MTASLTSEAWPTLTGRQEPHHLSFTDGDTTHGEKAVLLKERIGVAVMPWQREAQLRICSTTPASRWTHPTACLLCTRQNGKSEIPIDRCIYGLFKLGETILYTAQRWKTARDAWKRTMASSTARISAIGPGGKAGTGPRGSRADSTRRIRCSGRIR